MCFGSSSLGNSIPHPVTFLPTSWQYIYILERGQGDGRHIEPMSSDHQARSLKLLGESLKKRGRALELEKKL